MGQPIHLDEFTATSLLADQHFFNGRLLSAEALRDEQSALMLRDRLGLQSLGAGIVRGLEVSVIDASEAQPKLRISAGLAVTRHGDLIDVREDLELALVRRADAVTPASRPVRVRPFQRCAPATSPDLDTGFYVLSLSGQRGLTGEALASGLALDGRVLTCGKREWVHGIQPRLTPIAADDARDQVALDALLAQSVATDAASTHLASFRLGQRLRNAFAHFCFATHRAVDWLDGDGERVDTPPLERLLDPCDVPLATFRWAKGQGLTLFDQWTARRPVNRRRAGSTLGEDAPGLALALALRAQFQAQLHDVCSTFAADQSEQLGGPRAVKALRASDYFERLPSFGLLEVLAPSGTTADDAVLAPRLLEFFSGQIVSASAPGSHPYPGDFSLGAPGGVRIEGQRLRELSRAALELPPIDLGLAATQRELIWIYSTRQALESNTTVLTVVFASGAAPFVGAPRFDVNRFDFANFA